MMVVGGLMLLEPRVTVCECHEGTQSIATTQQSPAWAGSAVSLPPSSSLKVISGAWREPADPGSVGD